MALIQLIYMSSMIAREPEVLTDILKSSVRNNKRRDITGMLLCFDGNVMQVLEGREDMVLEIFRVILADVRHQAIHVVSEEFIGERQFSAWSMGFRQLTRADLEKMPPGANVFKAHRNEISRRARVGDARNLLKSFADGLTTTAV